MGSAKAPETACTRIVEAAALPDIFVSGCCPPEDHGHFVRFVNYVDRTDTQTGEPVREIVAKIVMTKATLSDIARTFGPSFREAASKGGAAENGLRTH